MYAKRIVDIFLIVCAGIVLYYAIADVVASEAPEQLQVTGEFVRDFTPGKIDKALQEKYGVSLVDTTGCRTGEQGCDGKGPGGGGYN